MKISIITPSFNQGNFIERTIQSVLSQDNGENELEYVVMDGGSTDQTVTIIKRYQQHFTWKSEPDQGQSHAVNKGLQVTTGEIIGWLNSDDIYYPETIKKVCQIFKEHPAVDVVYGDAYFVDENDKKIGFYPTEPWNLKRLKSTCFISQPAAFFRRRVVETQGLLDENLHFCMDYAYWLRLGLNSRKFFYYSQILSATRVHTNAKSSRDCVKASVEIINWVKTTLGYIPSARLVSHSAATTKATREFSSHSVPFVVMVWTRLWEVSGLYYSGLPRLLAFIGAQQAFLKELLKRQFNLLHKKIKYHL